MKGLLAVIFSIFTLSAIAATTPTIQAATGACQTPSTDYGTVTASVNVPATGTYYIWSRLATDSASHSSYLLQVDSSYCFNVGTSTAKALPIYAASATTHFANNATNWFGSDTSNGRVSVANLTAGAHTIKMIGNAPNVVLDRLIFTQDGSCTPTGTGDNCAVPPDTTAPTINITAPAEDAVIKTATTVSVNATDDVGVSRVEFYVDGSLKSTDSSSAFTYTINPTALSIGNHQIYARAYDAADNDASSGVVNFTIADSTAPSISFTAPASGSTQSGTIVASATATDNVDVTKVQFFADGSSTPLATATAGTGDTFTASIDTTDLSNGSHTLTAKAADAAANSGTATVTFTVNNQTITDTAGPVVTFTAPIAGVYLNTNSATVPYNSKSYAVTTNVADASGVKQVAYKVDGVTKATDLTAPYSYNLDLSTLSCGSHTVTAVATDTAPSANATTVNIQFNGTVREDVVTGSGCQVNYLDLSALASKYGQSGANLGRADINGDGTVNYLDLSALSSKYGQ